MPRPFDHPAPAPFAAFWAEPVPDVGTLRQTRLVRAWEGAAESRRSPEPRAMAQASAGGDALDRTPAYARLGRPAVDRRLRPLRQPRGPLTTQPARRRTETKKPSVPVRRGVIWMPRPSPVANAERRQARRRRDLGRRDRGKLPCAFEEGGDAIAVLLHQHRAGDGGDPAAGLDERGRAGERRILLFLAHDERVRPEAPLRIRRPPPGTAAGTGRIDQHEIGAAGEVGERVPPALRRPHPERSARPPAAGARRSAKGVAHRCRGRRSGRDCPSPPPARASCRRHRRKGPPPARRAPRAASSAASWLPSSWTSKAPRLKAGSACTGGPRPSADSGTRTPHGDSGVGSADEVGELRQNLLARGLQRVDAQIERRRVASAAPSSARSSPKARRMRLEPFRIVAAGPTPAHRRARESARAAVSLGVSGAGACCGAGEGHGEGAGIGTADRGRGAPSTCARGSSEPSRKVLEARRRSASKTRLAIRARSPEPAKRCEKPQSRSASAAGRFRSAMSASTSVKAAERLPRAGVMGSIQRYEDGAGEGAGACRRGRWPGRRCASRAR